MKGPAVASPPTDSSPRYLLFGGKGGTGKTTCAAAAAVTLADQGQRVLVVSTDPAHSLGDVFARTLGAQPTRVPTSRGVLNACELDADRALIRWLAQRRPALATIVQRGTILERSDIDPFLDLSLPGADEWLGLLEVERLAAQASYDCVVIDTAPTGHTLRLLAAPATIRRIARVLDIMQGKHRILSAAFGGRQVGDETERLIEELEHDGERLRTLLRDRARTHFVWVMLAEEMSVAESSRAIATLADDDIHVQDLIVNRLTPVPPSRCALCDGRRRSEAASIVAVRKQWVGDARRLWALPARDAPPIGIVPLRAIARSAVALKVPSAARGPRTIRRTKAAAGIRARLPVSLDPGVSTRLLIVGGKGGVGKTTCAATLALAVARASPARRVLLISTDPAHSIGDVLGQRIGDSQRAVRGSSRNLVAREIDAARGWQERREQYRQTIETLFETLTGGSNVDLSLDRAVVDQLFELAPPGMDEAVGLMTISDALPPDGDDTAHAAAAAGQFDLVVVDSAPTGHTRRLLALPTQALTWVHQFMALIVKWKALTGFERLAGELLQLSRGLTRLQALLTNRRACGFVVVTRPEQLPDIETARLIAWLARHHISQRALIINGVTPPGCARCRRIAGRERREIVAFSSRLTRKRSQYPIVLTDALASPPHGASALADWERTWRDYERP